MRKNISFKSGNKKISPCSALIGIMKQKIIILLGLLLIILGFLFLWWNQAIKPVNPKDNTPIMFTIQRGENIRGIAERLQKEGLIRSSVAFFVIARFGGLGERIQAGEFRLNPSMDLITIANNLTHGTTDVWITIPEGYRNEEIALKLTKEFDLPEKDFLKYAREGYMFPDTYLIPKDAGGEKIAGIMLDNFNKRITSEIYDKAKQKGLSPDNLITIASLVEREAKFENDRPLVASVILNRLKIGMKLDIDATIQYALGYQPKEKSWWKKELTADDLEIDSPYNTYKNLGLPPTPICNPGLSVIKAVVEAPETNYLYYLSDKSGRMYYATTIEEHNLNIKNHLNK